MNIRQKALRARKSSRRISSLTAASRNTALAAVRRDLVDRQEEILKANATDLRQADADRISGPLKARLKFDQAKIDRVCEGIATLEVLSDPLGRVLEKRELDKGLVLSRVTCPIGVIGMIFESRPDALIQIATLCLRSGNAVILKGGSEARKTNAVLTRIIAEAVSSSSAEHADHFDGWIAQAESRQDVAELIGMDDLIDLIVPRGSNEFVRQIMQKSTIPVLGHADGICHLYLDAAADAQKAVAITIDSKLQYTAVCNAIETLLVHQSAAAALLPLIQKALESGSCEIRGDERTREYIDVKAADMNDWKTEYLDAILSIKIVDSIDEAIEHIHCYGSGHTDAIVTENEQTAEHFLSRVDSADVFHNCSTRFADGAVFGLGAEVGIATSKIHARGPVGAEGLLSHRWLLRGKGQIIADYHSGEASFTHKTL